MEDLIRNYGYVIIFLGTFFEGETVLVVAGFLAHETYLNIYTVMLSAFGGSLLGDQLFFFIGKTRSELLLRKFKKWSPRIHRFHLLLKKHDTLVILAFRFIYGFRTVAPFAIGMAGVSTAKFVVLNVVSAAVWSVTVALLGFFMGRTLEFLLGGIKRFEMVVLGLVLFLAILFALRLLIKKKVAKPLPDEEEEMKLGR